MCELFREKSCLSVVARDFGVNLLFVVLFVISMTCQPLLSFPTLWALLLSESLVLVVNSHLKVKRYMLSGHMFLSV